MKYKIKYPLFSYFYLCYCTWASNKIDSTLHCGFKRVNVSTRKKVKGKIMKHLFWRALVLLLLPQSIFAVENVFHEVKEPYVEAQRELSKILNKHYSYSTAKIKSMDKYLITELHKLILANKFKIESLPALCQKAVQKFKSTLSAAQLSALEDDKCFTEAVLNKRLSQHSLAALHIASIMASESAIRWLVQEKKMSLHPIDKVRWTPAHFAAVHEDDKILQLFKSLGDSFTIKDINQANAQDLWKITHPALDQEQVQIWDEDSESVKTVEGEEFYAQYGLHFTNSMLQSPLSLVQQWAIEFSSSEEMEKFKRYQLANDEYYKVVQDKFSKKTDSYNDLYIKKIPRPGGELVKSKGENLGFGLYAGKEFAAQEIIGVYAGEWVGHSPKKGRDEYSTQVTDATDHRSYAAYSADGTPNVELLQVWNAKGVKEVEVLVALRPIAEGEAILWHYGAHEVKWNVYLEIDPETVDQFLAQRSLAKTISRLKKGIFEKDVSQRFDRAMLNFLADTPVVLIRLMAEERISYTDLQAIGDGKKKGHIVQDNIKFYLEDMKSFVKLLNTWSNKAAVLNFLQIKVKEGNMQILSNFIRMLLLDPSSQYRAKKFLRKDEFELLWNETWAAFCSQNTSSGRGKCQLYKEMSSSEDL